MEGLQNYANIQFFLQKNIAMLPKHFQTSPLPTKSELSSEPAPQQQEHAIEMAMEYDDQQAKKFQPNQERYFEVVDLNDLDNDQHTSPAFEQLPSNSMANEDDHPRQRQVEEGMDVCQEFEIEMDRDSGLIEIESSEGSVWNELKSPAHQLNQTNKLQTNEEAERIAASRKVQSISPLIEMGKKQPISPKEQKAYIPHSVIVSESVTASVQSNSQSIPIFRENGTNLQTPPSQKKIIESESSAGGERKKQAINNDKIKRNVRNACFLGLILLVEVLGRKTYNQSFIFQTLKIILPVLWFVIELVLELTFELCDQIASAIQQYLGLSVSNLLGLLIFMFAILNAIKQSFIRFKQYCAEVKNSLFRSRWKK